MPPVLRARPVAFVALAAALLLGACRGPAARRGGAGDAPSDVTPDAATGLPEGDGSTCGPDTVPVSDVPSVATEPGAYADDPRLAPLVDGLDARVRSATERLELVTGLAFRDRAAPRIRLAPLGDERVPMRIEREVVDGRRRAVVQVNLEPLVVGTATLDRVLARALAVSALDGAPTGARPPAWFGVFVGTLAAGDAADEVERLARRGGPTRVDPEDDACAAATGLAAALLLAERSTPADVRRLVALAADGDDPAPLVAKRVGAAGTGWSGDGREILEDALARADRSDLEAAAPLRRALDELGPEGLEQEAAALAARQPPTERLRLEVESLRLEGALRAGDLEAGRAVVARAPCEPRVLGLLEDPAGYVLAAARLEAMEGGDAALAWLRLSRFDRDFPKRPLRPAAFDTMEAILSRVPPDLEVVVLARVVAERGTAGLSTPTIVRRVETLLRERRPGAARRFLDGLGTRGDDGDLALLFTATDAAENEPDAESRRVNEARVAAWVASPSSATEDDVVDGGAVAAVALADRVPASGPARRECVRVMLAAGGLARAVSLLAPEWAAVPDRFVSDLEVLAARSGYGDLRRTVEAFFPGVRTDARAAAEWERLTLGLDPVRLTTDDGLLARLYSPEFAVRRAAFEEVVGGSAPMVTPLLLRRFAHDPAILLRRIAVRAAGREGFGMLAEEALGDPSGLVRRAACLALADAEWVSAAPAVANLLRAPDPEEPVRLAAAGTMLRFAALDVAWVRAVVSVVRVGDPVLADAVAGGLTELDRAAVGRAVAAELRLEGAVDGARADPAALFRLFVAYRRATGRDAGYDPSMSRDAVRTLVLGLPENGGSGVPRAK